VTKIRPLNSEPRLSWCNGLTIWAWHHGWRLAAPHAYKLLWAFVVINFSLLVFNLLPIYPLDGGQILRSLLWFVLGKARSLKVVAVLGLFGAIGLIAAAFFLHSVWIGLISLYMVMNCWTSYSTRKYCRAWSRRRPSHAAGWGKNTQRLPIPTSSHGFALATHRK
jgi:hypothetical protein